MKVSNRLIRVDEVEKIVGLSKSEIYRRIRAGEFPSPIPLGKRAVAWAEFEVNAWVNSRLAGMTIAQTSSLVQRLAAERLQRAGAGLAGMTGPPMG